MASAIEVFWQWSYLMALLLVILLLICCFGGCWGSFQTNVRGFCADGINCGFSPFRKKKVKTIKVTPVPNAPDGTVVMSRVDEEVGDSDSDDEDKERSSVRDKLHVNMGIKSNWCQHSDPISVSRMINMMQNTIVTRNSSQRQGDGFKMGRQYVGLFKHVLGTGRNNPYGSFRELANWVHRTNDRDIRNHLCKQFCWPNMNKPEVKRWLSTCISGMRVLKLALQIDDGSDSD